jgi:ribonuclease HI
MTEEMQEVLPEQAHAEPLHHTITVDGSYGFARAVAGVGLVIQQSDRPRRRGQVVDTIAEAFVGVPAGHVEALAVLRALEIAAERAFRILKIRSDHNQLRRTLREHHRSQDGQERDDLQSSSGQSGRK